ncbi:hypothetical protein DFH27DRAFT_534869 [Peziza echinospora]|nr:hypothetical protein DFH27DRAFT_534869 [Peziza echinospora]
MRLSISGSFSPFLFLSLSFFFFAFAGWPWPRHRAIGRLFFWYTLTLMSRYPDLILFLLIL